MYPNPHFTEKQNLTLTETLRFVSDLDDDLDDEIVDGDYEPKINNLQLYISLLHVLWLLFLNW